LNDAKSLITYGCVLCCSQVVYIREHKKIAGALPPNAPPVATGLWVGARKRFTCSAAVDPPSVRHSLQKQLRGPRRKQAEKDTADHSWQCERVQKRV